MTSDVEPLARRLRSAALGFCFLAGPLVAQEGPPTIEFSFTNPGARSLGFAGAFVALADDATAAIANPAGLVQLTQPEVSIEGRYWSYATGFVAGGRAEGVPTGLGIDTEPGFRTGVSNDDLAGIAFVSYVYPKERWAIAFYRHQPANFESSSKIEGLFAGVPELGLPARDDLINTTDLEVTSHALSGAYRLTDRLSLGVGVAHFDVTITSRTDDFGSFERLGPGDFRPENVDDVSLLEVDDTDVTLLAGFLWQAAERWSVGGFYREGPEVTLDGFFIAGPANDEGGDQGEILELRSFRVQLPDSYGLGTAFRTADGAMTVSFEWDRVRYSTVFIDQGSRGIRADDADELRLGFEHVLLARRPIVAWRLGAWLDPDHRPKALPDASAFTRAVFQGGEDELHFAVGVGVAFDRFQIDLGVDISDPRDVASVSAIYSF